MRKIPLAFFTLVFTVYPDSLVKAAEQYGFEVRPIGPTEAETQAETERLLQRSDVRSRLNGHRFRVLSSSSEGNRAGGGPGPLSIQVYDYTDDRLLTFSTESTEIVTATEPSAHHEVPPTRDEFNDAVELLRADPRYSGAIAMGLLSPYEAMPPVISPETIGSRGHDRIIPVGLRPMSKSQSHEIVGVNLSKESVHRFDTKAPPGAIATSQVCGPPSANQEQTRQGVPGSAEITIRNGDEEVWKFTVVRPSASSGRQGSGIELRNIVYRGHPILNRVHAPILNVRYDEDRCGPFRDWSYNESPFRAEGKTLAPGIMKTTRPPTTIFESNDDQGHFAGVAIHESENDVVLTSELSADWYRYVSEFRFTDDGMIQPRFKFSSVDNSCVCIGHTHHIYWRFDFDIDGEESNTVDTWNGDRWVTASKEQKQYRDSSHRAWRITNPRTGYGYLLAPGAFDGKADDYGAGDVWLTRYHDDEIDDSRTRTSTQAGLDGFLNDESLADSDIVMWYAGHFRHDHDDRHAEGMTGAVGPTLKPLFKPQQAP